MKSSRLIFGIVVLALGLFITWTMHDLEAENTAAKSWPSVTGVIITSERFTDRVDIQYRYQAGGETHTSRKLFMGVTVGDDITFDDAPSISRAGLLKRFPEGAEIPVYYDPAEPSVAVLLPEALPNTKMMKLIFGYLFIAGGLVLILITVLRAGGRSGNIGAELVLRVFAGLLFLGAGIGVVTMMNSIRAESRMAGSWPQVPATIKVAHVWTDHPEVVYTYTVDGREYESDQMYIGVPTERLTLNDGTELWPRQLNRRFQVGGVVQVSVDPDDPTNAVLLPDAAHNTDVPRYFGYALAVLGPLLAFFAKSGGGGGGGGKRPDRGPKTDLRRVKPRRPRKAEGAVTGRRPV